MRKWYLLGILAILLALGATIPPVMAIRDSGSNLVSQASQPNQPGLTDEQKYENLKDEINADPDYNRLTEEEWEDKIFYRGIDHKAPDQLDDARYQYARKVPILRESLARVTGLNNAESVEEAAFLTAKISRLRDKFAVVVREISLRDLGLVEREIHRTTYYIDLDSGNDGAAGTSTGTAWLTLDQYTTVTVRSAGDIAKVRANTDQIPTADIGFDEDGAYNNRIEIHGCSSTDDPWSDSSDVKPSIDFNDTAYQIRATADRAWRIYRLELEQSDDSYGALHLENQSNDWVIEDCDIHDNDPGGYGVRLRYVDAALLKGCDFYTNGNGGSVNVSTAAGVFENCTFNDGAGAGTNHGLYLSQEATVHLTNCTFGATTEHGFGSIYFYRESSRVIARNCLFSDSTEAYDISGTNTDGCYLRSEDHDQVKGGQKAYYHQGTIERDSAVQLDSLDSAKMTPGANVGADWPLTLSGHPHENGLNGDYQIWCPASSTTITLTARETAAWGTDPTSSEFYIEASYLSSGSGGARSTVASNDSLSGVSEVDFDVNFTPSQAGWVYITVYLEVYEDAADTINISIQPTVS